MAVVCGVITRRQFAGYFAKRRRFLRQRSAAWRRRGRAGRGARHRHAPPPLAGSAVAVHRVELQGPLERGARHGATAVGGGAAFSSLPVCSVCDWHPGARGPWPPGGEGRGARPTSSTGGSRGGKAARHEWYNDWRSCRRRETDATRILATVPDVPARSTRKTGTIRRCARARTHGTNAQLPLTKQTLLSVAAIWPLLHYARQATPRSLALFSSAGRPTRHRSLFLSSSSLSRLVTGNSRDIMDDLQRYFDAQ